MPKMPTSEGPPLCWGRGSADAPCDTCRFSKSCAKAVEEYRSRVTVAQACADIVDTTSCQSDVDALLDLIRHAWENALGKPLWTGQWNGAAVKIGKVLPEVVSACVRDGWDPATYVKAQVECMTPLIRGGGRISAGTFYGANAHARFERWVARRQAKYGSARDDATASSDRHKMTSATLIYAHARCIGGSSKEDAVAAATDVFPAWMLKSVSPEDRVRALFHVLGAIDQSLPHRIYMVPGAPPTWSEMRRLCDALRHTDDGQTHDLEGLGELL